METNIRLEKSLNAMKKQAEGASNGYKKLMEENETLQKQVEKIQELFGKNIDQEKDDEEKKKVWSKLIEENVQLTIQLEHTKTQLQSANTKIDAIQTQATNQNDSFLQLVENNQHLTAQVAKLAVTGKQLEDTQKQNQQLLQDKKRLEQEYELILNDVKKTN
jgi:regulator of replication initiation timing